MFLRNAVLHIFLLVSFLRSHQTEANTAGQSGLRVEAGRSFSCCKNGDRVSNSSGCKSKGGVDETGDSCRPCCCLIDGKPETAAWVANAAKGCTQSPLAQHNDRKTGKMTKRGSCTTAPQIHCGNRDSSKYFKLILCEGKLSWVPEGEIIPINCEVVPTPSSTPTPAATASPTPTSTVVPKATPSPSSTPSGK